MDGDQIFQRNMKGMNCWEPCRVQDEKVKEMRDVQVLELVHSYMIGPLPTHSYGNSRYVLIFIDDFSSYCWVFFLKLKSEVFQTFKFFKASVEKFNGK